MHFDGAVLSLTGQPDADLSGMELYERREGRLMSEVTRIKRVLVTVSLVAVVLAATVAQTQGEILNFGLGLTVAAELDWEWDGSTSSVLTVNPVSDGTLTVNTPYAIPGIYLGVVNGSTTTFSGATLDLGAGLSSAGPADDDGFFITQPLGGGTVQVWSADPGAPGAPTLLLSGTISSAEIHGLSGTSAGTVLSANDVIYNDGAIVDLIGAPFSGSFSWSLLEAIPPLTKNETTGLLNDFTGSATGSFTPEPTTMALLGIGGVLAVLRRRRKV